MANWFVVRNGKEEGPYSNSQLKALITLGQLQGSDLVRRDDMSAPRAAETIKGQFKDNQPSEPPPLPPPSKAPFATPPAAPSVQTQSFKSNDSKQVAPALWNPTAVGAWSLLFSWMFGSILTAKNWRALGEAEKARRAMFWFYGSIPLIMLAVLTPASMGKLFRFVSIGLLLAWMFIESFPQRKYIKERFGSTYPRKGWLVPLGIALSLFCLAIVCVFGQLASQGSSGAIAIVKEGTLRDFPTIPVGKALEQYLENPRWESGVTKEGKTIVNVKGRLTYMGKEVDGLVQFYVDTKAKTFAYNAFELNGVPQIELIARELLGKAFAAYRK